MAYVIALFALLVFVVTMVGTKLLEVMVLEPLRSQRAVINRAQSELIIHVATSYDRSATQEQRLAAKEALGKLATELVLAEVPGWLVQGGFGIDQRNIWDAHRYLLGLGEAMVEERTGELSAEAQAEEVARLLDFDRVAVEQLRESVDDRRLALPKSKRPLRSPSAKPASAAPPPPVQAPEPPAEEPVEETAISKAHADPETPDRPGETQTS